MKLIWVALIYLLGCIISTRLTSKVMLPIKGRAAYILKTKFDVIFILLSFVGIAYLPFHNFLCNKYQWYFRLAYNFFEHNDDPSVPFE